MGTYLRFGLTTLIMFFLVALTANFGAVSQVTLKQAIVFLIIVFTSGGSAMLLYYYGLKRVTASVSAICELAFPLSAILFEFIWRGRALTWSQWLGVLILFIAIYQVSILSQKPTPA
jgi:drug/metabolite transporter (DMT)-like permease